MDPAVTEDIKEVIAKLERERNVRVLYACESGSRAWGFASPDSDYDLRFIYSHRRDWYLEINDKPDTIDLMLPNDLDLSGWELRKTLRLFATCNLALNEWLDSPIVYQQLPGFREELASLIPSFLNPRKAIHHYLSMAKGTAKDHFDGDRIKIKKLFYILRPLFACYWIEETASMPPTYFQTMLDRSLASDEVLQAIKYLQTRKLTAIEGEVIDTPSAIKSWIHQSIAHFETTEDRYPSGKRGDWADLNAIMLKWTQ